MRVREIDGLRAAAVLAVIAHHFVPGWVPGGSIGVDLFFVISGYVITAGLLREEASGSIDLPAFYVRRAFRILPPLFALLLITFAVAGWHPETVPAAASYMNWHLASGGEGGLFEHAWSLSAEEQFYLLWPLTLIALRARSRKVALVGLIVAVTVWRLILFNVVTPERIYFGLDTRADALFLGCLLAVWEVRAPRWLWPIGAVALLGISVLPPTSSSIMWPLSFSLVGLASAALVSVCLDPPVLFSKVLNAPIVQWVGVRSYSLYLWHFPIYAVLKNSLNGRLHFATSLVLTFLIADLSYRLLERPLTAYGRTVLMKRKKQVA